MNCFCEFCEGSGLSPPCKRKRLPVVCAKTTGSRFFFFSLLYFVHLIQAARGVVFQFFHFHFHAVVLAQEGLLGADVHGIYQVDIVARDAAVWVFHPIGCQGLYAVRRAGKPAPNSTMFEKKPAGRGWNTLFPARESSVSTSIRYKCSLSALIS